jgi:adenylate cyclase
MSTIEPSAGARLESRNEDAFAEAERHGLMLAAKVRTVALLVVLLWVAVDHPGSGWSYLYDLLEVSVFIFLGVLQLVCTWQRFHIHTLKYVFVLADCAFLALISSSPNPFEAYSVPPAVLMNGSQFTYFFVLLMQASFSLLPSLVLWCGICIAVSRACMLAWFLSQPGVYTNLALPEQTVEAFVQARADPNFIYLGFVAAEILVVLIVATGLAFVVKRSRQLVESRSLAERSRASLARYFSPNVVDHLSNSEDPVGHAREQNVAVLFADIVGFTTLCEHEPAADVINLLRDYHDRLGQAVFDNNGTLDKYIGDGLMATFGTPDPGPQDAANALQCAMDMIALLEDWNAERVGEGKAPVRVGIGLHYGAVIAGDIGNERRLEYSVIGDTVNIASRLEHLTRNLNSNLVVSDSLVQAIDQDTDRSEKLILRLIKAGVHDLKGRETAVAIWTLRDPWSMSPDTLLQSH